MVRISLWLLLAVFGAGLVVGQVGEEDRVIRVEWTQPDKDDLLSITVEEQAHQQQKQWKKAKPWSKIDKKFPTGEKYSAFERVKRSPGFTPLVAPLVAPPLVTPALVAPLVVAGHAGPVVEAVQEAQRVVNEHLSQAQDAHARIGLDHRQAVIDGLVTLQDGQWVGELAAQQAARHAQAVGEVQAEVVRAVGDQVAQVADVQRNVAIDQAQLVDDAHTAAENSKWVGQLAAETVEQNVQRQGEVNEEVVRVVGEQQAQLKDVAERQGLELADRLEDGRWVGHLAKESTEREVQRQTEVIDEANRQVSENHAQAADIAERQGLAVAAHVEDTKWVGQLANEAVLTVIQNHAVVPHLVKKRETREKRSNWVAQLQLDRVNQAHVEAARQAGEAVRLTGEAAREVGEAHRQAAEVVNRHVDAANVHYQSKQWVGPWLHDAATQQSLRLAEAQAEAVRRAGELHRSLGAHHLWKRSGWVAQLQHDRVNQAHVEAARQAGEVVRLAGEAAREVGEAHRQAAEVVNRHVDAANVHYQSKQWVGPWLHDAATQQSLRLAEAQAEAVRRAGELHRSLGAHHLWKRSGWIAQLHHDRVNQANVEAARQAGEVVRLAGEAAREVGEAHRQAAEVVNRHIDAANVHYQSKQWVGPWLQDAANQRGLRVTEAQVEALRQANELQRRLTLHHLKKRALRQRRSNWVALLHHDRLNQAQIEAVRQINEHNRQAADVATQHALRLAEARAESIRQVNEVNRHTADVLQRQAGEAVRLSGEAAREVGEAHRQAADVAARQLDAANVHILSKQWVGPWLHDAAAQQSLRLAEAQAEAVRRAGESHRSLGAHHLWKRSGWIAQLHHDRVNQVHVEAARQAGETVRLAGEAARQGSEVHRQAADIARRQLDAANVNILSKQWVGPWLHDAAAQRAQRGGELQAETLRQAGEAHRQAADLARRQQDAANVHVLSKQWVGPWVQDAAAQHTLRVAEAQAEAVRRAGEWSRHLADVHHRHKRSNWVAQLINENGERAIQSHGEAQQEVVRAVTDQQAQLKDVLERGGLALEAHIEDGRWVGHLVNEAAERQVQKQGEVVQELGRQVEENRAQVQDVLDRRGLALEAAVEDTRWVGQLAHEAAQTAGVEHARLAHDGHLLLPGHLLFKRSAPGWVPQLHKENVETVLKEQARVVKDSIDQVKDRAQIGGLALQSHLRDGRWVGQLAHEAGNREVQRRGEVVQELGRQVNEVNARVNDEVSRAGLALRDRVRDTQWIAQLGHEIGARQRQIVGELTQEGHRRATEAVRALNDPVLAHRYKRSLWTLPLQAARDNVQEAVNTHRWVGQLAAENLATGLQGVRDANQETVRQVVDLNRQIVDNIHNHPYYPIVY